MINRMTPRRVYESAIPLLLIAMMLALSGCAPATVTMEAPPTPSVTVSTPSATSTTQPTNTPKPTSFVPKAVIKIVSHGPLSGNQGIFGTDMLRGAQLAVQQLAGPLAKLGYQIELVPYDDRNNLDTAKANTLQIIADREILCGVGHFTSRITVPMSEMYHQAGLTMMAPSTTSPNLTDRRYDEINRLIGRVDRQGIAGAKFAKDQGFTTVYIISEKDQYGLKNAEYFRLQADGSGIQVLGMVILGRNDTLESVISRVMAANPELVYYGGRADQAILFFREARAAGYMGTFLGIDDLNNPPLLDLAGPSLVQGGGLYFTILTAPANFHPDAAKFIKTFEVHYNTSPLLFAARAYDATGICIKAIEVASKAKGGEIPTRAEVVDAIRTLKDYQGITGTYTFNDQGDPTLMQYYVFKVVSVDSARWDQNSIVATYDVTPP
ncbi:MAG: branched-chain amino acid ABC transporter substrate-binding protein [Anaerolineales bacterium]